MLFKIAFRNILRNSRRSVMTMSAVAVGAIALILFGEFMAYLTTAFQTSLVQTGHLSIFRAGYFDFGAGNPAAYGIGDYQSVEKLIQDDPILKPLVLVVTPTVRLFGHCGQLRHRCIDDVSWPGCRPVRSGTHAPMGRIRHRARLAPPGDGQWPERR